MKPRFYTFEEFVKYHAEPESPELLDGKPPCRECKGTGRIPCDTCNGRGECLYCHGECGDCEGRGWNECDCGADPEGESIKEVYDKTLARERKAWEDYERTLKRIGAAA